MHIMTSLKNKHFIKYGIAAAIMTFITLPVTAQSVLTQQEKDSLQKHNRTAVLSPRITIRTVDMNDGTSVRKNVTSLDNAVKGKAVDQIKEGTTTSTLFDNRVVRQTKLTPATKRADVAHAQIVFVNPDGSEVQGAATTFFGRITSSDGNAVAGATVSILGKTATATTDSEGMYRLEGNFGDLLWVPTKSGKSYASYTTTSSNRYDFVINEAISAARVKTDSSKVLDLNKPLIVVDGQVMDADYSINKIKSDRVKAVTVLKPEQAKALYGDKGANGAIEIKLR